MVVLNILVAAAIGFVLGAVWYGVLSVPGSKRPALRLTQTANQKAGCRL